MDPGFWILIIENDPEIISNLSAPLKARGYNTLVNADGQSAMALCREWAFDLALIDVTLPGMQDMELVAKLTDLSPLTEYIFITDHTSLERAAEALEQNRILAYETKPLDIEHLITLIDQITVRRQAENTLRESEERFRNLIETIGDWVWEVNENSVYTYVSPQVKGILGYEVEDVVGKTLFDLMPPDEANRVADIINPIAASRRLFMQLEKTNIHKDGFSVDLETSGVPFFDVHGIFRGYRGVDRYSNGWQQAKHRGNSSLQDFSDEMKQSAANARIELEEIRKKADGNHELKDYIESLEQNIDCLQNSIQKILDFY